MLLLLLLLRSLYAVAAAQVIACDWNPAALECLRRGLEANRVADKCGCLQCSHW